MHRTIMKRFALGVAGLLGLAVAAAVAYAVVRTDDTAARCFEEQGDAAIAACTYAIQSDRFRGAELAAIYDNRAIELRQRGDYDRAIADYSQAIRIDAQLAGAYTGRGLAFEGRAEVDKARNDYRKALTLAPKYDDGEWAHATAHQRLAALSGT
jgi:tetratricopeptide (TPR) repeat protein